MIFRHFPRRNLLREELARTVLGWVVTMRWQSWGRRWRKLDSPERHSQLDAWLKTREQNCSSGITVMQ
jgi:hypothetical protein